MPGTIRVGVVDDHPSILAAISAAVEAQPDLTLSGTGRTLDEAIELLARSDVLLCDVQLEGSSGLSVLDAVREADPAPAVLLISGHGHRSVLRAALERGAAGYLDKSAEIDTIIAAVVAGRTNAEIAAELGLSEKTVETHLHRLFDRYAVLSRTELAVLAVEEGWARADGGGRG